MERGYLHVPQDPVYLVTTALLGFCLAVVLIPSAWARKVPLLRPLHRHLRSIPSSLLTAFQCSPLGMLVSFMCREAKTPSTPQLKVAAERKGEAILSWKEKSEDSWDPWTYDVEILQIYPKSSSWAPLVSTLGTSLNVFDYSDIEEGSLISLRVKARGKGGEGQWSLPVKTWALQSPEGKKEVCQGPLEWTLHENPEEVPRWSGRYFWRQTPSELEVSFPLPSGAPPKDVKVFFRRKSLDVQVKDKPFLSGTVFSPLVADDCFWQVEEKGLGEEGGGKPFISISMMKAEKGLKWKSVLEGHPPVDTGKVQWYTKGFNPQEWAKEEGEKIIAG